MNKTWMITTVTVHMKVQTFRSFYSKLNPEFNLFKISRPSEMPVKNRTIKRLIKDFRPSFHGLPQFSLFLSAIILSIVRAHHKPYPCR